MIARRELPHPGRPTHLQRRRGLPLPGLHHRPRRRRRLLPRRPLSGPGTLRTSDLRRQGHRTGQPALGQLRHQRRLAGPGPHRRRSVGLDEGALPRRRAGPGRAQATALHALAHRRRAGALGAAHHLAHRRGLALGRRPRGGLHSTAELVQRLSTFDRSSRSQDTELIEHAHRSGMDTSNALRRLDRPSRSAAPTSTMARQIDHADRLNDRIDLTRGLLKGPG